MKYIVESVRESGDAERVRLGSQVHALGFYEKLGFKPYGAEYVEADIKHRNMEIVL
ncbi:GNAT family N-acetyltransferase [Pseudovibrio sp. JE062]|uniref:GNAT family N-acetyltransferase n=1 Tax=Pseudovibrio sp. JE062 TaxID=439495 RepID=UPI000A06F904